MLYHGCKILFTIVHLSKAYDGKGPHPMWQKRNETKRNSMKIIVRIKNIITQYHVYETFDVFVIFGKKLKTLFKTSEKCF